MSQTNYQDLPEETVNEEIPRGIPVMPSSNFQLREQNHSEVAGTGPVFPNQQMPLMFRQPNPIEPNGQN